jgi:hypothetical protein
METMASPVSVVCRISVITVGIRVKSIWMIPAAVVPAPVIIIEGIVIPAGSGVETYKSVETRAETPVGIKSDVYGTLCGAVVTELNPCIMKCILVPFFICIVFNTIILRVTSVGIRIAGIC